MTRRVEEEAFASRQVGVKRFAFARRSSSEFNCWRVRSHGRVRRAKAPGLRLRRFGASPSQIKIFGLGYGFHALGVLSACR
jgi:hypothetical protein